MYLTQKFKFGTNNGEYEPLSYVQDSIFNNSIVEYIIYNSVPVFSGWIHTSSISRFDVSALGGFNNGDELIVHFYKY